MKNNSIELLKTPQKQSPVAILLILYKFFMLVIKNAFPVLLVLFFKPNSSESNFEVYIIIVISLVSAALSIAAYYKFNYLIQGDEIIINKGILKKINLNVPFDRIQAINTNQTLIHRIFNVASIEIDTAGSKNSEIKIDAINYDLAETLKKYILSEKEKITSETELTGQVEKKEIQENTLLQLDIPTLLKVGFSQNHIQSFFIITFFFLGLSQYADIFLNKEEFEDIEKNISVLFKSFFLAIIPLMLIATLLLSLFRTVLKYYNLIFKETSQGYRLVSGLFTRIEKQAALQKIQLVGWHTNPLKKLYGMFQLNLSQAFSSSMVRKQTMQIPGIYAEQIERVCNSYFPENNKEDYSTHPVSPRLMIRTFSFISIVLVALVGIKYFEIIPDFEWLMIAFAFAIAGIYTYCSWKKWEVQISPKGLLLRRGFIRTSYLLLRWEKIQGLRSRQSIFQKRRALSDLHIFTAAGVVKIPYLKENLIEELRDYLLYYVESDDKPWM